LLQDGWKDILQSLVGLHVIPRAFFTSVKPVVGLDVRFL